MRRFLIIGQTGVGKSSLINSVFGTQVADISAFEACTKVVEYYGYETAFGDVCLIDTPGLSEDTMAIDIAYLCLVRDAIAQKAVQVTLYVTRLNDTRFRADEKRALKVITTHLGASIWRRSWLVMTFAASIPENRLHEAAQVRSEQIATFLHELTAAAEGNIFNGFARLVLIDNVVPNWHRDAVPISSVLLSNQIDQRRRHR